MKKRLWKYIQRLFIRYVPGTSKLATLEAKRLTEYIVENYDEHQQFIIQEEIKANLIIHREKQIEDQELSIINEQKRLLRLKNNLLTLNN